MLMEVIHGIEVNSNKVKISPWKIKQDNLDIIKYIKGGKFSEAELGKTYMPLERVNPENLGSMLGLNSRYLTM